jgi:Nif-specific regulatory protein
MEKENTKKGDDLFIKALNYQEQGDFQKAIELYELIVKKTSLQTNKNHSFTIPTLYINLADCYSRGGSNIDLKNHLADQKTAEAASDNNQYTARYYYCLAAVHFSKSQYSKALENIEYSLEILNKSAGEKEEVGFVFHLKGLVYLGTNDFKEAQRCFEDARTLFRLVGEGDKYIQAVGNLGLTHKLLSEWTRAKECFETARQYGEKESNKRIYRSALINLGLMHLRLGEYRQAGKCFDEVLGLSKSTDNSVSFVRSLICQGMLFCSIRKLNEGEKKYKQAIRISKKNGYLSDFVIGLEHYGQLLFERKAYKKAVATYSEGLEISEKISPKGRCSSIYGLRAEAFLKLGKLEAALDDAKKGLGIYQECGNRFEEGRFHGVLGQIYSEVGETEKARNHFEVGIGIFKSIRARFEHAKCLLEYSRFHRKAGKGYKGSKISLKYLSEALNKAQEIEGADHLLAEIYLETARVHIKTGEKGSAIGPLARAKQLFEESKDLSMLEEVNALIKSVEKVIVKENKSHFSRFKSPLMLKGEPDDQLRKICSAIVDDVRPDRAYLSIISDKRKSTLVFSTPDIPKKLIDYSHFELLSPESQITNNGEPIYAISPSGHNEIEKLSNLCNKEIWSMIVIPFGDQKEIDALLYLDRTIDGKNRSFSQLEFEQVLNNYDTISELIFKYQRARLREKHKVPSDFDFSEIITKDPKFLEVLYNIRKHILSKEFLIQGESGTGKELVARVIHRNGPRKNKVCIPVSCAAVPDHLMEDEFLGHAKGAFTGAQTSRKGLFEEADGGMIFLDEIDKMSKKIQEGLLRVIECGEVRRLGEARIRFVDVAIICASSRNLKELVDSNLFLPELYYRISPPEFELPPLKRRQTDIPVLADHFIKIFNSEYGKDVKGITKPALRILKNFSWPGNVRELKRIIKVAIQKTDDGKEITLDSLPSNYFDKSVQRETDDIVSSGEGAVDKVKNLEREIIIEAIRKSNGNIAKAARELGYSDGTLRYKINKVHDISNLKKEAKRLDYN